MHFSESIEIAAGADELFVLTQDYGRRLTWDPFLSSAELLDGAVAAGVGVRALCVAKVTGLAMETEYVSFHPPQTAAVRMTRGPWWIRSFAGSWRFAELVPCRTRVQFRYHVETRPAWLAWLLTPPVGRIFARNTRNRLQALQAAVDR